MLFEVVYCPSLQRSHMIPESKLSAQSWVSMFSWLTASSQQHGLCDYSCKLQNKMNGISVFLHYLLCVLLLSLLCVRVLRLKVLFTWSACCLLCGPTVINQRQYLLQRWGFNLDMMPPRPPLLNKKPGKRTQAPRREPETGHRPSKMHGGQETNLFYSRSVQTPGPLLDLPSQRSAGWRPRGWQQGVEFHEADWCYISNKPKRLLI